MENIKRGIIHFQCEINPKNIEQLRNCLLNATFIDRVSVIDILFSSGGGNLESSFSIYELIKLNPIPVEIYNFGSVDSAGIIIFLSSNTRIATPNSKFLIHSVSRTFHKDASLSISQLTENLDGLRIDIDRYARVFTERTKDAKSPIDIRQYLEGVKPFVFGGQTAVEHGVATEVRDYDANRLNAAKHYWVNS